MLQMTSITWTTYICYKNPSNPAFLNLNLTTVAQRFQSICIIETGLPDFYLITLTVMRKNFKK